MGVSPKKWLSKKGSLLSVGGNSLWTLRQTTIILIIGPLLNLFSCSQQEKLTAEMISKISDQQLEQVIVNNILANMLGDTRPEREIVRALTPGQRAIYVTMIVEAEVNNGGFNQFYFNSSGQLAGMSEEAFKTIGAKKFAELARQADLIYDGIKEDLQKYDDGTIESFSKSYDGNPLNDLDDKFYDLYAEEPLQQLKIKYIRDNVKEFVTE